MTGQGDQFAPGRGVPDPDGAVGTGCQDEAVISTPTRTEYSFRVTKKGEHFPPGLSIPDPGGADMALAKTLLIASDCQNSSPIPTPYGIEDRSTARGQDKQL